MAAADSAHRPAQGLDGYFTGAWTYLRVLDDRRLGATGSILGVATFTPEGDDLLYDERGRLAFAGSVTTATRRYRFSFPERRRARVRFDDGLPFHDMDLTDGADRFRHSCPPDLYEGQCRLLSADGWQLAWQVSGPRKDLRLTTVYRRFADPLHCFSPLPTAGC